MPQPLVSVVIPVYNGALYLGEAIESVLAQSDNRLELIVVDDGSTDGTRCVIERFTPGVRALIQEQAGPGAARNAGVAVARGELLSFLDADDLWTPDKLSLQVRALAADPDLEAVYGHMVQFHSPELSAEQKQKIHCPAGKQPGNSQGTLLIRRAAFDRVGLFSTDHGVGEFLDWYARAREADVTSLLLSDVLLHRRLHQHNLGIMKRGNRQDYARILKAVLQRRRHGEAPLGHL